MASFEVINLSNRKMAAIDMDVDADVDAEPADESMDYKHAGPSVEDDSHVQDFEYFSQHGIKHATSNRTLSDLRMPSDKVLSRCTDELILIFGLDPSLLFVLVLHQGAARATAEDG